MIRRATLAFVTFIALSQTATAGVPLFGHVSCGVVRFYVAKYSQAAAEKWARGHGAGDAEIETARRCLHSPNVQTASSVVRSQVLAPATGQERVKHEPPERNSDQEASVQGQRAAPEQDKPNAEPPARGFIRRDNMEGRSARYVSHQIKDLAPSDRKSTTLRPRYAGTTHRAARAGVTGHFGWLKRVWARLTRPHRSRIAFLHFRDGQR
jgi:hypothetical protein